MEEVRRWLVRALDEGFDAKAWHGPNLLGSIRGLTADQALWRPGPDRHNVWEIVLHCAYWKHRVRDRVTEEGLEDFPRRGSDWPELPERRSQGEWRADVGLLKAMHARLREVALALPPTELDRPGPGQKRTRLQHLFGMARHDAYHAGQIRLLRLLGEDASWS